MLTASAVALGRLAAPRRVLAPGEEGVRAALHAAAATLPYLRRGLTREPAEKAIGHLHALTQAKSVLIADGDEVLAYSGDGAPPAEPPRAGGRVAVEGHTIVAPLVMQGRRIGALAAYYDPERRLRPEDTRVVSEVAALVSAQVELSALAAQEQRLAQAELRALRAQISPHFIYNALAAVANSIHTRPEEARELLTEFAEFTRYAFRGNRSYVTLADELHYVEKYLRLEQARFGDRLDVRVSVAPEVLTAVVPVLSMQPLVENAIRHGVESAAGPCRVEILGANLDTGEVRTVGPGLLRLAPGEAVPVSEGIDAQTGEQWSRPVNETGRGSPLLVYSLLLATFLGTMGLPHILVRFYTNPDGSAARRTTVRVLGLLGAFYLFPGVYGLLGRALTPELYTTGDTDSVVLRVPSAAWPGWPGDVLAAVVAVAAFMSTASGLLVSIAGTVSHDVWPARRRMRRRRFRVAAGLGMIAPTVLALATREVDISVLVGWAFALAASTFCPLLLLGVWWPRLTAAGAAVGMLAGALVATGAIAAGLISDVSEDTALGALLAQPAAVSVPLAFGTMVLLSLRTRPARDAGATMAALHVPERVPV